MRLDLLRSLQIALHRVERMDHGRKSRRGGLLCSHVGSVLHWAAEGEGGAVQPGTAQVTGCGSTMRFRLDRMFRQGRQNGRAEFMSVICIVS
jgi:hypothetical protein